MPIDSLKFALKYSNNSKWSYYSSDHCELITFHAILLMMNISIMTIESHYLKITCISFKTVI